MPVSHATAKWLLGHLKNVSNHLDAEPAADLMRFKRITL